MILVVGLTGCFRSREPQPFPTYFTRIFDGAELRLGMTLEEAVEIWGRLPDYYVERGLAKITVLDNDAGEIFAIVVDTEYLTLVGGISVGDNIQSVIDQINGGIFSNFYHHYHNVEAGNISFFDAFANSSYFVMFWYGEDGIIIRIVLTYSPEFRIWQQQQEG